ncbi:MAG: fibronectin type III domain-containing protein, partial [Paludibacteraceae bacterium]|nr:fibronectin type III domain-containing protein [Paludibacteraceae bacterium]
MSFAVPTLSDGAYAILPPMVIDDIRKYQMTFDIRTGVDLTRNTRSINIGILTDPEDLSTYTITHRVTIPESTGTQTQRLTVRFDQYDGDLNGQYGKYIMLYGATADSALYIDIDNICIMPISECGEPINVQATEVGSAYARFKWQADGMRYEVRVCEKNHPDSSITDRQIVNTTWSVVRRLESPRTYYLFVRTFCDNDTSRWSERVCFTTACRDTFALPYAEDFEAYQSGLGTHPDCWHTFYGNRADGVYPCIEPANSADQSQRCLYLHQSGYGSMLSAAALPEFDRPVNELTLSLHYRSNQTDARHPIRLLIIGTAEDVSDAQSLRLTFTPLDTIVSRSETYTAYERDFTDYTGNGRHLVFMAAYNDSCSVNGGVYIDNLMVEHYNPCKSPVNLQVIAATSNTLEMQWTNRSDADTWQIGYRAKDLNDAPLTIVDINRQNVTIAGNTARTSVNGLIAGVEYEMSVRAVCGQQIMSDWSLSTTGTTECVASIPTVYDFDDTTQTHDISIITDTQIPNCW